VHLFPTMLLMCRLRQVIRTSMRYFGAKDTRSECANYAAANGCLCAVILTQLGSEESGTERISISMKLIAPVLLLVTATAVSGQSKSGRNSVEQILIQMEHDWSEADLHKDATALKRILADDWMGIDFEGTVLNKEQALAGIVSDSGSLESTVLRNMKVRVYRTTAVVTGIDTESGDYHGKDSSGRYLWTDVFVRRGGRWQAVSSQSTRLTAEEGLTFLAELSGTRKLRGLTVKADVRD
jgi:hypothetical protein